MKTVYGIYKPVLGYDDQHEVYFTCTTRQVAQACADKINGYLTRLNARLPKLPDYVPDPTLPDDHPEWVTYNAADDRFQDVRNRARWPYGVDLFYWRNETNPIEVVELKLWGKT